MERTALRRGLLARARFEGAGSLLSWLVLAGVVVHVVSQREVDEWLPIAVFGGAALAHRIAIATEYVHCDADALQWRTLFAAHTHRWHEVQLLEVDFHPIGLPIHLQRRGFVCLRAHLRDGRRYWLLASAGCDMERLGEFVAAARLLSPYEWAEPGAPLVYRPSGRRVGRPRQHPDGTRHGRRR